MNINPQKFSMISFFVFVFVCLFVCLFVLFCLYGFKYRDMKLDT